MVDGCGVAAQADVAQVLSERTDGWRRVYARFALLRAGLHPTTRKPRVSGARPAAQRRVVILRFTARL